MLARGSRPPRASASCSRQVARPAIQCAAVSPRRHFSAASNQRERPLDERNSGQRGRREYNFKVAPRVDEPIRAPYIEASPGKWMGAALLGAAIAGVLYANADEADAKEESKKPTPEKETPPRLPARFIASMKGLLGDRFVTEYGTRAAHGKDFSYHAAGDPEAVLFPLTSEEVQAIARLCNEYKVAIVPYGSGTSLEGHTAPASDGVITVDFSKMNKLLRVNPNDLDAVVQPGIQYEVLNEMLKPYGLFFPLDPGPHASIGGMVGTSCSGTNAVRYGTMKENVISLKAVLPDGSFVSTGKRARKKSAGYDLTHLFIGGTLPGISPEGTLGLVTEITIRLHKIPEQRSVAVCNFATIEDAANTVMAMMQKGVRIGRVELLDDQMMKAVNMHANFTYPIQPHLFFEFSGSPAEVHDQIAAVEALAKSNKGGAFKFATEGAERDHLWRARKEAFWAASALRPGADTMTTDVCVPVSRLAECIHDTKQDIAKSKLIAPLVGHVGDGNFHLFVMIDSSNKKELEQAHQFNDRLVRRAIGMEGTCSGEHGVGTGKMAYLPEELGPEAVQLMKTIKKAIDPNNILNPGKVVNLTDPLNRGHEYGK